MKYPFHVDLPAVADEGDELSIQVRLRGRLRMIAPYLRVVATPNAGKRSAWAAQKAKAEGLFPGWPDVSILGKPRLIGFLEIKTRSGALSSAQCDALNWLHRAGFPCGVFRSVNTACEHLQSWGFINGGDK